jgi:hypothetical protein
MKLRLGKKKSKRKKMQKSEVKTFIAGALFSAIFVVWYTSVFIGPDAGFILKNPYSAILFHKSYNIDNDMRKLALTIADGCAANQECVIIKIYDNLSKELTYSNTPYSRMMDPEEVWDQKSGDCKSVSGLYVNMLINMGVLSYMDTSIKYNHAVAIAEPKGEDYYYMIDLTGPIIIRYNKGVNHWDYFTGTEKGGALIVPGRVTEEHINGNTSVQIWDRTVNE